MAANIIIGNALFFMKEEGGKNANKAKISSIGSNTNRAKTNCSGVGRIAEYVKEDIRRVTGCYPPDFAAHATAGRIRLDVSATVGRACPDAHTESGMVCVDVSAATGSVCRDGQLRCADMAADTHISDSESAMNIPNAVIYGIAGQSAVLDALDSAGIINLDDIRGKWEVYLFKVVQNPIPGIENALVIAGSDKRGTIYGLFHLSELIGVSPLVNWNHVWPQKRDEVVLDEGVNMVSRVPSVKYRGFFINDEWPAFGTWAEKHFGGINAECYERIFELLLRLKGNYLWPAMWASNFSMDGPGLKSAELADEMGIVMSTSHHEPCMRSGEEYKLLRGKDSPYGDAWSFFKNREGITNFWRDGLMRNAPYENVITMGMRGEQDTAILGPDATLEDNVRLIREVLHTQNELIRETVNENLDDVPRQIVLFTEVERFFYGTDDVKGFMDDEELDGVTLMLSDNNHGAMRTLPTKAMRKHKGGYGMYYHMDMHGGAHSYQWIGSTYLPKVWEQMTMAYEYGVRQIWVTNVGDVATQEHGLSFFLDLAYDMDRWGGSDITVTEEYTRMWLKRNFGGIFDEGELKELECAYNDHLMLLSRRKHEVMNDKVYHPVHFGEAEDVLTKCRNILDLCGRLLLKCPDDMWAAYISLIHYPLCGTANLMKMWILAGRNALYAGQNRLMANIIADELEECFSYDEAVTGIYQSVDDGYFDGFGMSEHIGFRQWNDEDNQYPLKIYVRPANGVRMIVARKDDDSYMTGGTWTRNRQIWTDGMRPDVSDICFDIAAGGKEPVKYHIETECEWLGFSKTAGSTEYNDEICLHIDRGRFTGRAEGIFKIVNEGHGTATVRVIADNCEDVPRGVYMEHDGIICVEADHFADKKDTADGGFVILKPYGRTGSAIKAYPVTADFTAMPERPCVEYRLYVREAGEYMVRFYLAPTTPVTYESRQYIAYSVNDGDIATVNTVEDETREFFLSPQWTKEAYANIKLAEARVTLAEGVNTFKFFAASPAILLERIVLYRDGVKLPDSYLGPRESYIKK